MQNELEIENKIKDILSEVFKDLIINTKQTFDLLLKQENPSDLISLYGFYYYTAKWQKTNQPKATIRYVMKGLKWGEQKTRKRKIQLVRLGLIQDIRKGNKWYIKINYIWGENTILDRVKSALLETNRVVETNRVSALLETNTAENQQVNALSVSNLNALNANILASAKPKGNSFLKRKECKYPKEWYNRVLDEYQRLRGITLQGKEFEPAQQAIKTMFMSDRSPDDIIAVMKWFADNDQEWTKNWTIRTIKLKLPEVLAGAITKEDDIVIPSYAKNWANK